jgi:predicted O-methyltransferase YrrM
MALIHEWGRYYAELPFAAQRTDGLRYFFENPSYSYSDAIFLYCMMRHLRPKRIIEVGSGYSSCVILDTNDLFFHSSIQATFIEPHPELFLSLIKDSDKYAVRLISTRLQDTDPQIFEALESNDILFIDSTHVSKIDSDVNRIFFEILPRLAPGVHVHFHDIFYPFEYPKQWIYEGCAWTEAYLLRSFLEYNSCFRVVLMNTFLEHFHREWFAREMPLCLTNTGGSIWIRREM